MYQAKQCNKVLHLKLEQVLDLIY